MYFLLQDTAMKLVGLNTVKTVTEDKRYDEQLHRIQGVYVFVM